MISLTGLTTKRPLRWEACCVAFVVDAGRSVGEKNSNNNNNKKQIEKRKLTNEKEQLKYELCLKLSNESD